MPRETRRADKDDQKFQAFRIPGVIKPISPLSDEFRDPEEYPTTADEEPQPGTDKVQPDKESISP